MAHPLVIALMKKKGLNPVSDPAMDDKPPDDGGAPAPNEKVTPELESCAADVLDAKDPTSLANALADFIDMYQGGPSPEPEGEDEAEAPAGPEGE